jgi:hypothetical protein
MPRPKSNSLSRRSESAYDSFVFQGRALWIFPHAKKMVFQGGNHYGNNHDQFRLARPERQLYCCQNINISRFRFNQFEFVFNNPCDTSATILKSDIDNLKTSIEIAERKLHELRVRIARG